MQRGLRQELSRLFVGILILSATAAAHAATVGVGLFQLSPDPVYIKAGEAVYWTEADPDFGPYIISGPWGNLYAGGGTGVQFLGPGTYGYTAQSIYGGQWSGSVVVSPNSPPVVTITSPTNNSAFIAPATLSFEADASDPDPDDLSDVEFWVDDQKIDDVFAAPFATTVTNLAAGSYTLTVIAWDFSGATATNSVTVTVLNPGPVALSAAALFSGSFRFDVTGLTVGKTNLLQTSTNLASSPNWVSVATNVAESATVSFTNAVVPGQHFYRIVQLP